MIYAAEQRGLRIMKRNRGLHEYTKALGLTTEEFFQIIQDSDYILELGMGEGKAREMILEQFPSKMVIGADLQVTGKEFLYDVCNLDFCNLPLASTSVDAAYSIISALTYYRAQCTISAEEQIELQISEIHRVLRLGGLLVLALYLPEGGLLNRIEDTESAIYPVCRNDDLKIQMPLIGILLSFGFEIARVTYGIDGNFPTIGLILQKC